ncbi:MAG TPA: acetyl-CoA C-acetyltransferase [Candidatus Krumholzibacteria bacterium]|nr:acetyl-CoA C-acetyltransferase [Candidatus Krumholzibacteria bacterium]
MSTKAVILSGARTPVGKFQGGLAPVKATELGAIAVKAAVERAKIPAEKVNEVVMGCVLPAGLGQNPARQATIYSGLPNTISAMTINKVCGSGLRAVALAAQFIKAQDASLVVAGGMESMSNAPYALPGARTGYRLGNGELIDLMVHDGLWDIYNDFHMGMTAELVADKYKIAREEQDQYALQSHQKALAAIDAGKFKQEIVPVEVKTRKGSVLIDTDEGPRRETTLEALAKLRPAFKRDGGTVTAGNAPSVNDGAAAVIVASEDFAKDLGAKAYFEIEAYATGALEPEWVMMAPVKAVRNLLAKTKSGIGDFSLIELNEAFSVQALAVMRELEMDPAKVNVNGGAVALGHPIGASGTRILVTLMHAMIDRDVERGLAALCLGGGDAVALSVRRIG